MDARDSATHEKPSLGFENGRAMLTLYDGLTYEPATNDLGKFRVTKFQQQQLALQLTEDLERSAFQNQNPRSMHISQLKAYIGTLRSTAPNSKNPDYILRKIRSAEVEYHKKILNSFCMLRTRRNRYPAGIDGENGRRMLGFGLA